MAFIYCLLCPTEFTLLISRDYFKKYDVKKPESWLYTILSYNLLVCVYVYNCIYSQLEMLKY